MLQALRAHDERLDAVINQSAFAGKLPEQVLIERVSLTPAKKQAGSPFGAPTDLTPGEGGEDSLPHREGRITGIPVKCDVTQ